MNQQALHCSESACLVVGPGHERAQKLGHALVVRAVGAEHAEAPGVLQRAGCADQATVFGRLQPHAHDGLHLGDTLLFANLEKKEREK